MRRLLWILLFLIGLPVLWFVGVVIVTEPPIMNGEVIRDVAYKPGKELDIYTPTRPLLDPSPVILYIHGGAWIVGSKEALNFNRFHEAVHQLRDTGYTIISLEYTLGGDGKSAFPECLTDVGDALAWVTANAGRYSLDTTNIGLFGESAGAHIAMMTGFGGPGIWSPGCPDIDLRYVLDIYGPNRLKGIYDMPLAESWKEWMDQLPTTLTSRLDLVQNIFGFDPRQDSLRAERFMQLYSPFYYTSSKSPPTLIIQGDLDHLVPVAQSIDLQCRLDSLDVPNRMIILPGVDHGFLGASSEQKAEVQNAIVDFILAHTLRTEVPKQGRAVLKKNM